LQSIEDFDHGVTGFDNDEIDALIAGDLGQNQPEAPEAQIDRAAELQAKWKTERGQVWEIPGKAGTHTVACADVGTEPMECEALVFDPPWDAVPETGRMEFQSALVFCDGRRMGDVVHKWGAPVWVFVWDCVSCWYTQNRPLQRMKLAMWYGDVSSYDFNGAHYGDAGQPRTVWNTRGKYEFAPDRRGLHLADVFASPITRREELHAHAKPADWIRLLLGNCTQGIITDPFLGSGTTMVAAEQLGRVCYGMEIEPKYVAVTLERLADMGLEPKLADTSLAGV